MKNNIYDSNYIENFILYKWNKDEKKNKEKYYNNNNYSILFPPLNITGSIHIGHSLQHSIIDFLIRLNRMNNKNIFCKYGLDHAGISTQILIEKKNNLYENKIINKKKNIKLIKESWIWKKNINNRLNYQIKKFGILLNTSKCVFTLNKKISYSVKYLFIKMYENNLIYKKNKITNWDTKLCVCISDLEITYKKSITKIWNIKYFFVDKNIKINNNNFITVSTIRPETIIGDSAIAINPNDNRYNNLIGKKVLVPITNREIPIISDNTIDIEKGTGCVKITPAHNPIDYNIGIKNSLPIINIFNKNGNTNTNLKVTYFDNKLVKFIYLPKYLQNLDRKNLKNIIIKKLNKINQIYSYEDYETLIPYSNKSNSIIEYIITDQWYVKTKELSEESIDMIKKKEILFLNKKYENIYINWVKNIEDWCISRQIWWGHSIPIWYDSNNNVYVGFNEKNIRYKYKLNKNIVLTKDKNVLDTWFSSSIFHLSSLGWPNNSKNLKKFYPYNIIISGFDIIYFWILKMIIISCFLNKNSNISKIPFKKIYITGLINDEYGNKMSKSNGNTIESIDIINGISLNKLIKKKIKNLINDKEKDKIIEITKKKFPNGIKSYGADSLRLYLISLSYTNNKNIKFNFNILDKYKSFCNKIWNINKFIIKNVNINKKFDYLEFHKINLDINKYIVIKFNNLIKNLYNLINNNRFDIYLYKLYNFIRNEFCNWYIEFIKIILLENNLNKINESENILINIFKDIIKLLHPIIPFITEYMWLLINKENHLLILQKFPLFNVKINLTNDNSIDIIKNIIINIRNIKNKFNIINKKILINTKNEFNIKLILYYKNKIIKLSKIDNFFINNEYNKLKLIYNKILYNYNIEIIILN